MEEAERLCDRVVIIDHGKIITDDTLQGLYRVVAVRNLLTVELEDGARNGLCMEDLRQLPGWNRRNCAVEPSGLVCGIWREIRPEFSSGGGTGHRFQHLASERASLETVFLTLTGRSLRD